MRGLAASARNASGLGLVLGLVLLRGVCGAEPPAPGLAGWVGQRVVVRTGGVVRPPNTTVPAAAAAAAAGSGRVRYGGAVPRHRGARSEFTVYLVGPTADGWLWVEPEGAASAPPGWVRPSQVVGLERATREAAARIDRDPSAASYAARGNLRLARGEPDAALTDFDEAVRLDPADEAPHYDRGLAWSAKGDPRHAEAAFTEALRLDPGYARAYEARGRARRALGDFPGALRDFDAAARLDPRSAAGLAGRAWVRATAPDPSARDPAAAAADAARADALARGKSADALGAWAAALAESGAFDRAAEVQTRALGLDGPGALDPADRRDATARLLLYRAGRPARAGPPPPLPDGEPGPPASPG